VSIFTANFKPNYFHNLSAGDFLIKITGKNEVTHYFVENVISDNKIKVSSLDNFGNLTGFTLTVKGTDIENYIPNIIANQNKERGLVGFK